MKTAQGGQLRKRFNSIDYFGEFFKFYLPGDDNAERLTTTSGAILTIIMWSLIVMYGSVQLHSLSQFGATDITTSFVEFFYDQDTLFPQEIDDLVFPSFQIAFGLAAFDEDPEPIDDPRYGRVLARTDGWGYEGERNKELSVHRCSEEELGLTEDKSNSRFYPLQKNFVSQLQWNSRKMFCIDDEVHLNGDFNTDRA